MSLPATRTYAKGELLSLLEKQETNPSYSLSEATAMVNANLDFINDADKTGNNNTGRTALIWASQSHAPNLVYALIVAGADPTKNFVAATNSNGKPTMYLGALEAADQQNKGSPEDLYIIDVLTRAKAEWESTGKINPSNYKPFSPSGKINPSNYKPLPPSGKGVLLKFLGERQWNFAERFELYPLEDAIALVNANLNFINDPPNEYGATSLGMAIALRAPHIIYALLVSGADPTSEILYETLAFHIIEQDTNKTTSPNINIYIINIFLRAKAEWEKTGKINPSNYKPFSVDDDPVPNPYAVNGSFVMPLLIRYPSARNSSQDAISVVNANLEFINRKYEIDESRAHSKNALLIHALTTPLTLATIKRRYHFVYALIVAGADPRYTSRLSHPASGVPMYYDTLDTAKFFSNNSPGDEYIIDVLTRAKAELESTGKINPSNYKPFSSGGRRKYRGSRRQRKNRSRRRKYTTRR
jgi:hypothetical protein